MSTRCQIGIYSQNEAKRNEYETLLYRHSDGYPEEVLPDIEPFVKDFKKRRGFSDGGDVEYLAAWLIHHLIEKHVEAMKEYAPEVKGKDYLGHGVCGDKQIHGDIEFFYAIYPDRLEVYGVADWDSGSMGQWEKITTIPL